MRLTISISFSILFSIIFVINTNAQSLKENFVVQYLYTSILDTNNTNKTWDDDMRLSISDNSSAFYSQLTFEANKIINDASNLGSPLAALGAVQSSGTFKGEEYTILKNYTTQKLDVYEKLVTDTYFYNENFIQFEWELSTDTSSIMGYHVRKAVGKLGGKTFIAWYAPDIPIMDGPWKFTGLPGLILQVNDTNNYFVFKAIGIEKQAGGTNIIELDESYRTTTKNDFLKMKYRMLENPLEFINNTRRTKIRFKEETIKKAQKPFNMIEWPR